MEEERKSLQTLCREAKDALGMTSQELAERSGIPLSTVNNTFAARSKEPSIYTLGPMCAVTGTSVDEYFHIRPRATAEELIAEVARRHAVELENAQLMGEIDKLRAVNKISRRTSAVMFLLSALVIVYLLVRLLVFDASVPTAGTILHGQITAAAWVLIFAVAAIIAVMIFMLLRIIRRSDKSDEPMPELPVRADLMKK